MYQFLKLLVWVCHDSLCSKEKVYLKYFLYKELTVIFMGKRNFLLLQTTVGDIFYKMQFNIVFT